MRRYRVCSRVEIGAVFRDIRARAKLFRRWPFLDVFGNRDVRDGATRQSSFDRLVENVDHMSGTHDTLAKRGNIHEQFVEIDILLIMSADQIVEGMTRDSEHRLPVALGVVQSVEQMNASGSRGRKTDSEPTSVFGVPTGGERGGFLVPHLNEPDLIFPRSQRFKNS